MRCLTSGIVDRRFWVRGSRVGGGEGLGVKEDTIETWARALDSDSDSESSSAAAAAHDDGLYDLAPGTGGSRELMGKAFMSIVRR